MAAKAASVSALQDEITELRADLRRAELRLAGARKQLDQRLREPQVGDNQLDAMRQRAERAEARLVALLDTRTMRTLRVPRDIYSQLLARRRSQR